MSQINGKIIGGIKMDKFSIAQPMEFKNEIIVRNNETGKLHKAILSFNTDDSFKVNSSDKTITFNLTNDDGCLWTLAIKEEIERYWEEY